MAMRVASAGGKMSARTSNTTAYPWNEGTFAFEVKALWDLGDTMCKSKTLAWAAQMRVELSKYFIGSYVNYIDPTLKDWPVQYYGSNLQRLKQIKKRVDPTNFFAFEQSIPI